MPGAIALTAKACYHSGAGLVLVATTKQAKTNLSATLPEAYYLDVEEEEGYLKDFSLNSFVNVIICGPGLGRKKFTKNIVEKVALAQAIVIFDADSLYFFDDYILNLIKKRNFPTILTPHNGEMATLCNIKTEKVEKNRFLIAKKKAKELNSYILLKGPYSIITTPFGQQFVNFSGNPGLAKGGSGDVLAGIVAAFAAKGKNIQHAVCNAAFVHGKICDKLVATKESKNTITPTKIINNLNILI